MFRSWLWVVSLALLFGCASEPEPMRTGIAPNPRYHPPDPTKPTGNAGPAVVGDSAWQSEATKWIGAPYRAGGNGREGMDTIGLIRRMYENVARIKLTSNLDELTRTGVAIQREQLRPGDIIFFGKGIGHKVYVGDNQYPQETNITGAGIYLGDNRIVTAEPILGVAYARLFDPPYSENYLTARRILR